MTSASILAAASIEAPVGALRSDYRALLIVADGLAPGPSDPASGRGLPHIAAWRDAFRFFGATPQRTRTRLSPTSTRGLFIIDALAPMSDDALGAAADALMSALSQTSAGAAFRSRLLRASEG